MSITTNAISSSNDILVLMTHMVSVKLVKTYIDAGHNIVIGDDKGATKLRDAFAFSDIYI